MISKIFQANHQNRGLNTEATGADGLVVEPLEAAVKAVALVTRPLTPINKTMSLVIGPLALVAVWHLLPLNYQH